MNVEVGEENVELHKTPLLITFLRRRIRKSMLANYVGVITYLMSFC